MPTKEKSHFMYVAGSNKIQCKIISTFFDFSLLILRIHEIQMNFKSNWVEISVEICIK